MNLKLFNELICPRLEQHFPEWKMFLEICEIYLKNHKIENPVVVELGIWKNIQKRFWEQLFGATHIGIDHTRRRGKPDIYAEIHSPGTMKILKEKLNGRPINILFIDADHSYEAVKKDYEVFSPLCSDIIVLHDINSCRHEENKQVEVWRFWDELKLKAYNGEEEYKNFLFLSIHQYIWEGHRIQMGIGLIMKK